ACEPQEADTRLLRGRAAADLDRKGLEAPAARASCDDGGRPMSSTGSRERESQGLRGLQALEIPIGRRQTASEVARSLGVKRRSSQTCSTASSALSRSRVERSSPRRAFASCAPHSKTYAPPGSPSIETRRSTGCRASPQPSA